MVASRGTIDSTNYFDTGENAAFDDPDDITVMGWFRCTGIGVFQKLTNMGTSGGGGDGWGVGWSDTDNMLFTKNGVADIESSTITLSTNVWLFGAWVCDQNVDVDFYLYNFSTDTWSSDTVSNTGNTVSTTDNMVIGFESSNTVQIAALKIYLSLLTEDQVKSHIFTPRTINGSGLTSYWEFNTDSATIRDLVSGHDGTETGTVPDLFIGPPVVYPVSA